MKRNVCLQENSRRSQMVEGFTRTLGEGKIAVTSSGLESSQVDPTTTKSCLKLALILAIRLLSH